MEADTSKPGASDKAQGCQNKKSFPYMLTVTDNGTGFPEEMDFQNPESLGLQLVNILVEQIDGCIELKRECGTVFTIWFNNPEVNEV
jgi:two-component sensor histidine kinase